MRFCGQVGKEPEQQQQQAAAKKKSFPRARKAGRAAGAPPPGAEAMVVAEDEVEIIDDDDGDDSCATQVRRHQKNPLDESLPFRVLFPGRCAAFDFGRNEQLWYGAVNTCYPSLGMSWLISHPAASDAVLLLALLRTCICIPQSNSHGMLQVSLWGEGGGECSGGGANGTGAADGGAGRAARQPAAPHPRGPHRGGPGARAAHVHGRPASSHPHPPLLQEQAHPLRR